MKFAKEIVRNGITGHKGVNSLNKYCHIAFQRGCMVSPLSNIWWCLSLHILDRLE